MKADIHPTNYRPVIFQDTVAEASFLIGSTIETEETGKWTDGNEYPLYKIEISSASHPFYTGTEKVMDTGGRVDRFKKRMEAAAAAQPVKKASPAPVAEDKKKEESVEAPTEEVKEEIIETTEEVATEVSAEEAATEEVEPTNEEK